MNIMEQGCGTRMYSRFCSWICLQLYSRVFPCMDSMILSWIGYLPMINSDNETVEDKDR